MNTQFIQLTHQQGYAIVDLLEHQVIMATFRSNRKEAWNAFCAPSHRAERKRMGFACVSVSLEGEAAIPGELWKKVLKQREKGEKRQ